MNERGKHKLKKRDFEALKRRELRKSKQIDIEEKAALEREAESQLLLDLERVVPDSTLELEQRLASELFLRDQLSAELRAWSRTTKESKRAEKEEISRCSEDDSVIKRISALEDKQYSLKTMVNQQEIRKSGVLETWKEWQNQNAVVEKECEKLEKEHLLLHKENKSLSFQTMDCYRDIDRIQTEIDAVKESEKCTKRYKAKKDEMDKNLEEELSQLKMVHSMCKDMAEKIKAKENSQVVEDLERPDLDELELMIAVPGPLEVLEAELEKIKIITGEENLDCLSDIVGKGKYKDFSHFCLNLFHLSQTETSQTSKSPSKPDELKDDDLQKMEQETAELKEKTEKVKCRTENVQKQTDQKEGILNQLQTKDTSIFSKTIDEKNPLSTHTRSILDQMEDEVMRLFLCEGFLKSQESLTDNIEVDSLFTTHLQAQRDTEFKLESEDTLSRKHALPKSDAARFMSRKGPLQPIPPQGSVSRGGSGRRRPIYGRSLSQQKYPDGQLHQTVPDESQLSPVTTKPCPPQPKDSSGLQRSKSLPPSSEVRLTQQRTHPKTTAIKKDPLPPISRGPCPTAQGSKGKKQSPYTQKLVTPQLMKDPLPPIPKRPHPTNKRANELTKSSPYLLNGFKDPLP